MNIEAIAAKLEDQLLASGRLAGTDPAAEQVVDAIVTALGPAIRQAALVVRNEQTETTFSSDELQARMTVRLPSNLKSALEEAADDAGDSVNSFVLKTLATGTRSNRRGRRVRETFET